MSEGLGGSDGSGGSAVGAHVLLVDDDDVLTNAYRRLLEQARCRVTIVADAAEALRRLAVETFDVVVSDANLPRMTGVELKRALRVAGSPIPVILVSATVAALEQVEAAALGVPEILSKSRAAERLVELVRRAVGETAPA